MRLRNEGRDDLADVLEECGQKLVLVCACCRKSWTVDKGCNKRWCPVCARLVSAQRWAKREALVRAMASPLSVMLSAKNALPGPEAIEEFKAGFRGFRRTRFWREVVRGGIASFEVTSRGRGWHVHLHAIVDCDWLAVATPPPQRGMTRREIERRCKAAQKELSEVWGGYIQKESAIVWVRRAGTKEGKGLSKALAETVKYAIKPADLMEAEGEIGPLIDALDEGRLTTSFGNCHGGSKSYLKPEREIIGAARCMECMAEKAILPEPILQAIIGCRMPPTANMQRMLERGAVWQDAVKRGMDPRQKVLKWDARPQEEWFEA